ncbi:PAS domain-containing sensor histidine kinase [Poseidonibacter lekithochrous]|uniref:PAS domain-containing sensor histidine kinase n=1 Tax=Poseidonibacter lekithochrous TaxID=1904463 RepID=UPI000D3D73FF|nr:PAS domain-containing sensor histidine kinase [Poseidonibacter lekithochrous]
MLHQSLNVNTLVSVLNEVGAYIFTKDLEGKYTYANSLVLELFDITIDELIGKDDYYFFTKDEIEHLLENDKRVFNGEIIETEEVLVIKRTGEKRFYITVKKPLYDENKNIIGMFGISTDITEQKNLENKILAQKHFLDTILDNVDAYIYMKDKNRVFRYVNSKVAALFQRSSDEIIGKVDTDVIPKEVADSFWESDLEVLTKLEKISTEEYFEDENNKSYYWSVKIPYTLEDNTPTVLGFSTDITLLKQQEDELKAKDRILYHQAKISTMGEMIENIAHQWRQPLTLISSAATGTKLKNEMKILDNEELIENMENINNQAQYLSNTIEDFRSFFLADNYNIKEVNIKSSIQKTISLIKDAFSDYNIKFLVNVEDDISFNCNENLFIQALINILNNSKDVLKHINDMDHEKCVFLDLTSDENNYYIKITDNGNGIKKENLEKIFDPYFTTKHKSQGTGIGLYMTYQIIIKHIKTEIDVRNVEFEYKGKTYKGACFSIAIPKSSIIEKVGKRD